MQNIVNAMSALPMNIWKTITFDQGSEFANGGILISRI